MSWLKLSCKYVNFKQDMLPQELLRADSDEDMTFFLSRMTIGKFACWICCFGVLFTSNGMHVLYIYVCHCMSPFFWNMFGTCSNHPKSWRLCKSKIQLVFPRLVQLDRSLVTMSPCIYLLSMCGIQNCQ